MKFCRNVIVAKVGEMTFHPNEGGAEGRGTSARRKKQKPDDTAWMR
jgi:hypothetical protein